MGLIDKGRGSARSAHIQSPPRPRAIAQAALCDAVSISDLAFAEEGLEAQLATLCGQRYAHLAERQGLGSGARGRFAGGRRPASEV